MELTGTVSLIVPTYNMEAYLNRCVESILAQTYSDLQIILIDDGSTDSSPALCDAYAAADPRFLVIHQANGGLCAARNTGLYAATGDYIGFIDPDDWIAPNYVEVLLSGILENQADASFCGVTLVSAPDEIAPSTIVYSPETTGVVDGLQALGECLRENGHRRENWAKLFRRDVLYHNGVPHCFHPRFIICEDEVWDCELFGSFQRVYLGNAPLYYYYIRSSSASHNYSTLDERWKNKLESAIQSKEYCAQVLADQPEYSAIMLHFIYRFVYINTVPRAYSVGASDLQLYFAQRLRPYRDAFYHHPTTTWKRALRYRFFELMLFFHFPRKLVGYFVTHPPYVIKEQLRQLLGKH